MAVSKAVLETVTEDIAPPAADGSEGGLNVEDAVIDAVAAVIASMLTTTKTVSWPKFRCPARECWMCPGGCPP